MSSKRSWNGRKKISQSNNSKHNCIFQSDSPSSSIGFQTPLTHTVANTAHSARPHTSGNGSDIFGPRTPSGTLPLAQQNRISSQRQASHISHGSSPNNGQCARAQTFAEDDVQVQEREDADAMNEIIMAVDMRERGTVGCAFYIAREEKLCMIQDILLSGLEVIDTLKLMAAPTTILISTRADEALENHLNKEARNKGGAENEASFGCYALESRVSGEFRFDAAKDKLLGLHIIPGTGSSMSFSTPGEDLDKDLEEVHGNEAKIIGRQGRLIRLAAWIDLDSKISVGCAGAVLAYLQTRTSLEYLPGDSAALVAFKVKILETFALSDTMFVNAETLSALQILQTENHPNSHMQGSNMVSSGAKESLSVYGLFQHLAHTPQGKHKLRQMFLRPSLDIEVIRERQTTLGVLLRSDNESSLAKIVASLKKIRNIRTVVIHLQKGVALTGRSSSIKKGVWASLQLFTFHALQIFEAVCELVNGESLAIVNKILVGFKRRELEAIGQSITQTVDFELSEFHHRTAVLPGVDEKLDNMKRTYDGLESLLTKVATALKNEVPEWAQQYIENCVFFPQLGFLTVVPIDPESGQGMYEGESTEEDTWSRMFVTDLKGYFKNRRMKEMDELFGDMWGMIADEEIEIIHNLATTILEYETALITTSDICGELDCLVALARGAKRQRFVPPRMTNQNIIHITGGRHPLQELTVPSYIANDTYLLGGPGEDIEGEVIVIDRVPSSAESAEGPSLLMMTGPNYSGKSVYLKQIALVVYMAHIGSYVPAEKAIIGLTDKILTRIATRETVSKNRSAFMIDLQQTGLAIALATRRSLVVIDEFGKGTNASDGAGLACGVFEHFLSLGKDRPKVVAATHFHEMFENGFLGERPTLAFGHMEIHQDRRATEIEDQISYLYNFVPGKSTSSFGTYCAAMNGIDSAIIKRADQLMLLSFQGEDLVAACEVLSEQDARLLEEAEEMARSLLAKDLPIKPLGGSHVRGFLQTVVAS